MNIPKNFNEFISWSKQKQEQFIEQKIEQEHKTNQKQEIKQDKIIIFKDNSGNIIYHKNYNFFIKLKDKQQKREIGYFNLENNTFITTRKKNIHLFRKFNAWGFNYQIITYLLNNFGKINIKVKENEENRQYNINIDKDKFEQYKKKYILNFKQQGFELQVFIPVKEFIIK